MKRIARCITLSLLVLASLLALAGPAGAAGKNTKLHILFEGNGDVGWAVISGAIHAFGTDRQVAAVTNKDGTETDTDVLTFPNGTITVHDTQTTGGFKANPVTCIGKISGSGVYTVVGGTGAYKGASGSGVFRVKGTAFLNHTAKGCSDEPSSVIIHVTAWGPFWIS